MKNTMNKAMLALMLVLAMAFGAMAMAEAVPAEPPTLEAEAPAEAPADETAPAETAPADDSAALQAAMDALHNARQDKRQASFEEELQAYVAEGKLTQEQADLILNQYKARAEQRANKAQTRGQGRDMNGRGGRQGRGGKGGQGGCGMDRGMGRDMNGGRFGGMMAETAPTMPEAPAMDEGI